MSNGTKDLSSLSDEELFKIAKGEDLSSMSDEELFKIAGVQPDQPAEPDQGLIVNAASGFLSGLVGLGSLADLGINTAASVLSGDPVSLANGINPYGKSNIGGALKNFFDWATDNPNATELGKGSYARKFGEYLPGSLMVPGDAFAKIGLNALTSAGGYVGHAAGGLPGEVIGSIAAGSLPSVFRAGVSAAKNALNPDTQAAAREILLNNVANREKALEALSIKNTSPFSQYQRTAEVSADPGIAALEKAMQTSDSGVRNASQIQDAARELNRQSVFNSLSPKISPEDAGNAIREGITSNYQAQKDLVDYYGTLARSGETTLPTFGAKMAVSDALDAMTQPGMNAPSKEFLNKIDEFRSLPSETTLPILQNFRSAMGEYAGSAGVGADATAKRTAKIAASLRESIDSKIDELVGTSGLPTDQVKDLRKMIAERANQGATFETGPVADVLKKKPFNAGFELNASDVGSSLVKAPEDARQAVKALLGQSEGMKALRASLLDDVFQKAYNPHTNQIVGPTLSRQLRTYSDVLPEVLTKQQVQALEAIAADTQSQSAVAGKAFAASKSNSITSQNITAIEALQNAVKDKASTALKKIPYIGPIADTLYSVISNPEARQAAIRQELAKVVLEPKYAAELLQPVTEKSSVLMELAKNLSAKIPALAGAVTSNDNQVTDLSTNPNADLTIAAQSLPSIPSVPSVFSGDLPGVPAENQAALKKLMALESGGKLDARNPKSSAKGAFQLIDATAKSLGVTNPDDLTQAAPAANKLFQENLAALRDPVLAMAAHQSGLPKMLADIRGAGSTNPMDIINYRLKTGDLEGAKYLANVMQ